MNKNTLQCILELMTLRKIGAAKIFDGYRFILDHVLIMKGDVVEELVPSAHGGSDVEWVEGLICPGLVNCHCHLELSHMKGMIPEKTGLVDFVYKVVSERHHSETDIQRSIVNAESEMIANGIVAVGDICNNILTLERKLQRRLQYYNFIEASGWLPSGATTRFERARELFEKFFSSGSMLTSIVPHASYSVSDNLWKYIRPFFESRTVSIHNQETAFEDEFFLSGTGDLQRMYSMMNIDNSHHLPTKKSSLQSSFINLMEAANIILVHNTFTKQDDLDHITNAIVPGTGPEVFFCCCPNANLYIENQLPPIDLLRENHCSIVLGTDSLASNHKLDILAEIMTIKKNFDIPDEELLSWATVNGANALQMEKTIGSFERGKQPGVINLNHDLSLIKKII